MDNVIYPKSFGYNRKVKVSNWYDRMESQTYDDSEQNLKGASHYRSLGTDDVPVPKTSTQELLESGLQRRIYRTVARSQINFVSYPVNDFRLDSQGLTTDRLGGKCVVTSTTYQDNFNLKKPMIVTPDVCKTETDDHLNRIPKCGFEYLPSSENKFMDDQLMEPGENRKKIDFLRQIRNASNVFHRL